MGTMRMPAADHRVRGWVRLVGTLLIFTYLQPAAAAGDLSYLDALEAEADRLEMLADAERLDAEVRATGPGPAASDTVPDAPGRAEVPAGLSREQFEAVLVHYRGTHMLYEKLSEPAREQVFDAYHEDNRISEIRRRVVELL